MNEKTDPAFTAEIVLSDNEATYFSTTRKQKTKKPTSPKYPPDKDIDLWLSRNAPVMFHELADIRYSLYHHCSRAEFAVANVIDDRFDLTGRYSTLRIVSDRARRYLLWRLRLLGRKENWISALPRTKKPRNR
jgi:hypothetical protein